MLTTVIAIAVHKRLPRIALPDALTGPFAVTAVAVTTPAELKLAPVTWPALEEEPIQQRLRRTRTAQTDPCTIVVLLPALMTTDSIRYRGASAEACASVDDNVATDKAELPAPDPIRRYQ